MAQTGALAKDNHQKSWKYTSETSRTDRGHQRKFSIFVLPLFSPREGRPPALKPAWGATLPLQEWRVGSCPAAPRSRAGLLLWDDMLLYIPIWTRLLWNVRKCVVSGRHRQYPLLPATARSQTLFCVCILSEFDVVHKSQALYSLCSASGKYTGICKSQKVPSSFQYDTKDVSCMNFSSKSPICIDLGSWTKCLHCPPRAFQRDFEYHYIPDRLSNCHPFSTGGKCFGFSDMEKELHGSG